MAKGPGQSASIRAGNPLQPLEIDVPVPENAPKTPWMVWPVLCLAVLAVSSAAAVFASMLEISTFTLSAWRLQLTGLLLLPGAVVQTYMLPPDLQRKVWEHMPDVLASGTFLAFHFGLWVYSIHWTSLTHSLLCVSATPLFLALGSLAFRKPISAGELGGTAVGLLGGILLALGARQDDQVTAAGDLASLGACLAGIGYFLIGRRLRSWMPIFVYAAPVTVVAAGLLSIGCLLVEGASLTAAGEHGVAGWLVSSYLGRVLYLSLMPGIVGHTGLNLLLRWLDPLVVTLALNMEPLIGSVIGFLMGVASPPGVWTYAGGACLLAATAVVSIAADRRERAATIADRVGTLKRRASRAEARGAENVLSAENLMLHVDVTPDEVYYVRGLLGEEQRGPPSPEDPSDVEAGELRGASTIPDIAQDERQRLLEAEGLHRAELPEVGDALVGEGTVSGDDDGLLWSEKSEGVSKPHSVMQTHHVSNHEVER